MGHRANYVVRDGGKLELFYSHWGALHLLRDLFWGEEVVMPVVRNCSDAEHLMDDVWAEGGALIDRDNRRLLLFGVSVPGDDRPAFLELYPLTWPGWSVEYATGGIGQIAEAVGIDPVPSRSVPRTSSSQASTKSRSQTRLATTVRHS